MDSAETTEEEENKDHRNSWLRRSLSLVFSLIAFLSFSFVLGFVAVFVGSTAISNPISVPSQCKIVSSIAFHFLPILQDSFVTHGLTCDRHWNCGLRIELKLVVEVFRNIMMAAKRVEITIPEHETLCKGELVHWISPPIEGGFFLPASTQCVDLRSSKVCELGLLNYKAKHVLYPFERKKFRCHHDYYWASIFKVEYKDRSGETRVSLAEAPNEALPLDCRPNFGVAWLTKDKFKVNETYDCWYTFGLSKVYIYHNSFFNCHAKNPSTVEMLRRFFILSPRILESWFASRRSWFKKWEAIAGAVAGFSTSLISLSLIRVLQQLKSCLPQICGVRMLTRLKQVSLFVAYFSFVGWLAIQYGKKLGLPEIFRVP
ncbi:hypothetical protein RHSIM_Rhsim07G0138900 [Rhododendron simsii]|uniref:Uncharacterized protein n=1 Tax=Rhododendron simsii TaxID=118357 RepID=A0A834LK02_RHOSS|nr:hypothetical protein RHSIM_Rhsim07G0138900 [Rhododendron simsii]